MSLKINNMKAFKNIVHYQWSGLIGSRDTVALLMAEKSDWDRLSLFLVAAEKTKFSGSVLDECFEKAHRLGAPAELLLLLFQKGADPFVNNEADSVTGGVLGKWLQVGFFKEGVTLLKKAIDSERGRQWWKELENHGSLFALITQCALQKSQNLDQQVVMEQNRMAGITIDFKGEYALKDEYLKGEVDQLFECAKKLGSDVNACNKSGYGALHTATGFVERHWARWPLPLVMYNSSDQNGNDLGRQWLIEKLIKMGANPNQSAANGLTPLMGASFIHDIECVKALLTYGANAGQKDIAHFYPLSYVALGCANTGREIRAMHNKDKDKRLEEIKSCLLHLMKRPGGEEAYGSAGSRGETMFTLMSESKYSCELKGILEECEQEAEVAWLDQSTPHPDPGCGIRKVRL